MSALSHAAWICARMRPTLNELDQMSRNGRLTDDEYRACLFFWDWSAPRFHGSAGWKQDRAYKRLGKDAYYRRMARVNALCERLSAAR